MREPAAVLLGILPGKGLVLTKRAASLRSFTGHICLPGGKKEPSDFDLTAAAIREFKEEVYFQGIVEPLFCMLPEFSIVSQQGVFPVIAQLNGEIYGVNPEEVERYFILPFSELMPTKFVLNTEYSTIKHNQCLYYNNEQIWGLTAHILYQFTKYYKRFFIEN